MKRVIPILSIILFTSIYSQAQSRNNLSQDPTERIMKFYPNPATSFISFDFQKNYDKGYAIQVYNFLGKQVYEVQNVAAKTTINLADYIRGVY
ncbi:MAG: T9SS type A sorting domain-containing protein, partial [Bacteroidota bacterium]|nr:T9SS type A sorting domain-containing protein [Bacteroidota bacterium]